MIIGVKIILKQLENYKVLERAFATYPNYNLTITGDYTCTVNNSFAMVINFVMEEHMYYFFIGHSLGAGLAILLGLLIRPRYPDLRVYAFATPGNYLYICN